MSILVDTSVISQTRKAAAVPDTFPWWKQQSVDSLFLSVISVHEIRQGIELAPAGPKRNALEIWLRDHVLPVFASRILSADIEVADTSARLVASARKRGHTAELADALIAATAKVHGLKVATLNRKHFQGFGVELVKFDAGRTQ